MSSSSYNLDPDILATHENHLHAHSDTHSAQRHRGFDIPLRQAPIAIATPHISLHTYMNALICCVILPLASQLVCLLTSALLGAGVHIREPCRFHAQAWTSCGVPMKSLSSRAAAAPLPAVCWNSKGPATRLPELPWAPAPATKKPSTSLHCPSPQVNDSRKPWNNTRLGVLATGLAQALIVH